MNDQQQVLAASVKTVHAADAYLRAWKANVAIRATLLSGDDDAETSESRDALRRQADCLVALERATSEAMALMQ